MRRVATFAGIAAIAAVAVLVITEGVVEIVGFELIVLGLVVLAALALGPLRPVHIVERGPEVAMRKRPPVPPQLQQVEWMVGFATATGTDADARLIPQLRELAAARLLHHHGVDLYRQPQEAAALLGAQAWQQLDPSRPLRQSSAGPPVDTIEGIVDAVERL